MPGDSCRLGALAVKVSGSLLSPPEPGYLRRLSRELRELAAGGCRVAVVAGGGRVARDYIAAARASGVREALLDVLGIEASRLNALLLASTLYPLAPLRPPTSVEEAASLLPLYPVVVMGGLQPGQSTNAVAAALAEAVGASVLVNMLSGVDGVYAPRPGVPGARRLDRLTYDELWGLVRGAEQSAGGYELFDHVALSIARRSRLKIYFVDGRDPGVLGRIARGERVGSVVGPG
ncbi:MAG: UMP kinase [Desulfurococcales archaeon]|nr:UMP kinase [Desulfurococcales archaeon]